MFSLIKDFAITAVIIILNHFFYGVEDILAYEFVVDFIDRNQTTFMASGILGSGALLALASMFEGLGLYKVAYCLSKLLIRLSQFCLTFISILNIVFYAALQLNFIMDSGYLVVFVLVLILGSSCWALRIIDFNYHFKNAVVPVATLTILSILLVQYLWPLYGF